ncbi:MAG: VOC family protein [Nannocystaceae bacterium]
MKIDHLTLLVSSLEKSLPYYARLLALLGFERRGEGVWSDGEGFSLQILEARPGTAPYARYGAGMNHLGFAAGSPAEVRAIRAAMIDAGFVAPAPQELDGALALFMGDPDGIRFEITYTPPGASVVDGADPARRG